MLAVIADDRGMVLRVLSRMLDQLGWDCLAASSAGSLEALCAARSPDLVVCDVELGPDDGVTACSALSRRYPGLRVLMMTGNPDQARRAVEAGFRKILAKPFTLEDLAQAIDGPPTEKIY